MEVLEMFLRIEFGDGYGSGSGYGYGYGSGDGLKTINGNRVYMIDDVQTVVTHLRGNVAKGAIVNQDMTLTPCYVVKQGNFFAHGKTLKEAVKDVRDKFFNNLSDENKVAEFRKEFVDFDVKVPCQTLADWHHKLTGSCRMGIQSWVDNRGISLTSDSMTINEFLEITKDAYGGSIIKQIINN